MYLLVDATVESMRLLWLHEKNRILSSVLDWIGLEILVLLFPITAPRSITSFPFIPSPLFLLGDNSGPFVKNKNSDVLFSIPHVVRTDEVDTFTRL